MHYARGKTLGGSSARNYMVGSRYTDLINSSLKGIIRFITGWSPQDRVLAFVIWVKLQKLSRGNRQANKRLAVPLGTPSGR